MAASARRGTNRPRRPSSALASLSLVAMLLLFVVLFIVSGAIGFFTYVNSQPQQPFVKGRPPFNNGGFKQGPIIVPQGKNGANGPNADPAQRDGPDNGAEGALEVFNPRPNGPKFNDNLATRIAMQNGQAVVRQSLTNDDPRDPVQRWGPGRPLLPAKVFLVELQQGKKYIVDYQRQVPNFGMGPQLHDFDPYLRIESLDGDRLVEDDDIVHMQDLRLTR